MKTINVVLTASDEKTLQKKVENYKTCYPPIGYDTRVNSVQSSNGLMHAHIERLESCDQEFLMNIDQAKKSYVDDAISYL